MPPGLSPAPRVAYGVLGAAGPSGLARLRTELFLFQLADAFSVRRLTRIHCSWLASSSPLKCASPFCCPANAANVSFQGHFRYLFWYINVRDVSAYVLVQGAIYSDAHV